ncbi:hypothetical protein ACEWY4_020176 [Coilia grayii]|uniref:TOG domain-containing protein n=1 Tax=Coilia grayii TaxID=363190 RepID=A0ABD1JBX1_9TELE
MKLSGLGDSDALESVPDSSPSSASSLSPVDLRTPSVLRALPFLNTPSPPTVPTVPAPPQTAKPQTTNGGAFRSRLPRLKKTASLSVATAVKEQKSVESLAERNEGVRELKKVKKERVREEKQPRVTGSQKTRDLPELARLPSVSFPEQTFVHALRLLNNEDWEKKVEALTSIRSLSQHHAEVLLPRLHELCLAIIQEVKNLCSAVSRTAMVTLAYLYAHLGRDMDAQVEITARALLQKLCEAKGFIREDAELALRHMVASVSPSRSLTALSNTGVRSRCTAVRKSTAQLLGRLVEAVGSSRLLSGRREVTDRFIHAVSCLTLDCALEVSDALESVPDSSSSSASSLSLVDLRTPSVLRALPFLNTPSPPTVPTVPAPPQTAKPQTTNGGAFRSRLPRLKKTASLSVATAVKEQKSVESLAERNEGVRELKKVKKERVREEKQPRETGSQKTRDLPELARLPSVSFPEQTFVHALRLLNNEDWEKKVEALTSIRSLSQHHAEVLLPRLHELCLAIIQEVKNLRSAVSRTAMVTLAYLYAHLGRDMDAQVEITVRALLQKLCEAKGFIREDAELALRHMVANVSPSRSLTALSNTGVRSRCTAVRKSTAQLLGRLVEAVGSSRLLSGRREVTDRFIHAVSCLALDCALEVRTNARKCLTLMVSHPDLIKMVERYAPEGDLVAMKDIINKCQSSTLGFQRSFLLFAHVSVPDLFPSSAIS